MLRHLVVLFLHKISIVTNYLIIIIYCKCKHDFGGSLTDSWISVNPWSEVICLRRVYTILSRSWIVIVSGLNTSNKWCYRDFDRVFERTANFSTQWCAWYEKLRFSDFQKSSLSVYCLSVLCTRCVEVNTIFFFTSSTMIFTDSLHSADFGLMLHDGKICMKRAIIIYDWVSIHNNHAERMQGNKALAVS